MTSSLRLLILTLAFLSELALIAVLAIAGLSARLGTAANIALAVLAPVAVVFIWGLALAPRARRRLPQPRRLGAEVVLSSRPLRDWRPWAPSPGRSSSPWPRSALPWWRGG